MKLWLISQPDEDVTWDTYDAAVVAAETEEEAQAIHPHVNEYATEQKETPLVKDRYDSWCARKDVTVVYLGEAKEGTTKGVICASFNGG